MPIHTQTVKRAYSAITPCFCYDRQRQTRNK
nr:MAG TPA: hypothetical protein [Caudoviricetes sp.]